MTGEELRKFVNRELDAISDEADMAQLPCVKDAVFVTREKLNGKLKLAIAGRTKAGKSTFLNSLLRTLTLPTGCDVTTGDVTVLMHISDSPEKQDDEYAVAYLRDGSNGLKSIKMTIEKYQELVDIRIEKEDLNDFRKNIIVCELYLRHPALENMCLIDTPGGDSWLKYDSEKTKAYFKERTPDVVLYLFSKAIQPEDINDLKEYLKIISGGRNDMNGLNAVAIFSCCDRLMTSNSDGCDWGKGYANLATGILENDKNKSADVRSKFATYFAIAGLFSMAAHELTDDDFECFKKMSNSKREEVERFYKKATLRDIQDMRNRHPDMFKNIESEEYLNDMVTRIGYEAIKYAVWWCATHKSDSLESLQRSLDDFSNVPTLRKYIFEDYFNKFSFFFKVTRAFSGLTRAVEVAYKSEVERDTRASLSKILDRCRTDEKTLHEQYGFMPVLRDYYSYRNRYFEEDDYEKAFKTIQYIESDKKDDETTKKLRQYWQTRQNYYGALYNVAADNACQILITNL